MIDVTSVKLFYLLQYKSQNLQTPSIRGCEENEIKNVAVRPELVVVIDEILDSIKDRKESETKQMAAMPDLIMM